MVERRAAKAVVREIAPDGFWHGDTTTAYEAAAVELLQLGWSKDRVTEFLRRLFVATQAEYGE